MRTCQKQRCSLSLRPSCPTVPPRAQHCVIGHYSTVRLQYFHSGQPNIQKTWNTSKGQSITQRTAITRSPVGKIAVKAEVWAHFCDPIWDQAKELLQKLLFQVSTLQKYFLKSEFCSFIRSGRFVFAHPWLSFTCIYTSKRVKSLFIMKIHHKGRMRCLLAAVRASGHF